MIPFASEIKPELKEEKPMPEDKINNDLKLEIGFEENFRDRLTTAGVFQGTVVNIDYSDYNGVTKRIISAPLVKVGSNFIELSSTVPFPVFTFVTGSPAVPSVEFVKAIIIPILNVLDVRKV